MAVAVAAVAAAAGKLAPIKTGPPRSPVRSGPHEQAARSISTHHEAGVVRDRVCLVFSPGLWGRPSQRFVYPDGRPACMDACLALTSNRAYSKQNGKVVSSLSFTLPAAGGAARRPIIELRVSLGSIESKSALNEF